MPCRSLPRRRGPRPPAARALDRCDCAAPVLPCRDDLVAPVAGGPRRRPDARRREAAPAGPGVAARSAPAVPVVRGPGPAAGTSAHRHGRRGRTCASASQRRLTAASCRSPADSSAATAAAQESAACSHRPSSNRSIRREPASGGRRSAVAAGVVDLARGSQCEGEVVDDGVVGLDERRQPWLAQAASAPRPGGGGIEEVDVEEHRGRIDR